MSVPVACDGTDDHAVPGVVAALDQDLTGVCVATLDADLHLLQANDEFLARLTLPGSDVYGRCVADLMDPSVRAYLLVHLDRLVTGKDRRLAAYFRGSHLVTRRFTGEMTAIVVRGDDGEVDSLVLLVRPDADVEHLCPDRSQRPLLSELDALVLEGVAAGSSTVQLAAKLYLSRQGVEYHVGAMLRRFRCANRPALVARAFTQGVLIMGQWPPKVTPEHVR